MLLLEQGMSLENALVCALTRGKALELAGSLNCDAGSAACIDSRITSTISKTEEPKQESNNPISSLPVTTEVSGENEGVSASEDDGEELEGATSLLSLISSNVQRFVARERSYIVAVQQSDSTLTDSP